MNNNTCHKENLSFDAELIDANGIKIPVECTIQLPLICGDSIDISIAIPYSAMPIPILKNPCKIKAENNISGTNILMKDVWYRKLTRSVIPPRTLGSSTMSITHISSLSIIDNFRPSNEVALIYLSNTDFFYDQAHLGLEASMIENLACFSFPELGAVKLQRYWVKSLLKSSDGFLSRFGYQLEITKDDISNSSLIKNIAPLLDILSIFFRQRILVHGYNFISNGLRERFWRDPLRPLSTNCVSVDPKHFLVDMDNLSKQVNSALKNYHQLGEVEKKYIFNLSYSLSPAINLRDSERFMSLFRELEYISGDAKRRILKENENLLVEKFDIIAESFSGIDPEICERVKGFSRMISGGKPSLGERLIIYLQSKDVYYADLWSILGKNSLTDIRNKLTHRGAHYVHHQGLAVATLHLSLLTERIAFALLGISLNPQIHNQLKLDDWLQADYVRTLKDRVFDTD